MGADGSRPPGTPQTCVFQCLLSGSSKRPAVVRKAEPRTAAIWGPHSALLYSQSAHREDPAPGCWHPAAKAGSVCRSQVAGGVAAAPPVAAASLCAVGFAANSMFRVPTTRLQGETKH